MSVLLIISIPFLKVEFGSSSANGGGAFGLGAKVVSFGACVVLKRSSSSVLVC